MWLRGMVLFAAVPIAVAGCGTRADRDSSIPTTLTAVVGRVIDGTGSRPLEVGVVLIEGDRIRCVGMRHECPIPARARVLDAGEGTILPGLIDLHVHVWDRDMLRMFLPVGVTAVRDLHNTFENLAVLEGAPTPGPRLFKAGPLIDGRALWPGTAVAATAEAARATVDSIAGRGVDVIKLYHGLSPDVLAAASGEARRLGVPVTADLFGSEVDALEAMSAGVRGFEHAGGFLQAYRRLGGDPAAEVLDDALLDRLVEALLEHDAYVVPTLIVQRQYGLERTPSVEGVPLADRVPESVRSFWERRETVPVSLRREFALNERFTSALVRRLHERGGRIGAGSDLPNPYVTPGGALHQELELLVEAGLPPTAAIRAATGAAAEILGRSDLGVLQAGRLADVVVVEGNPEADIRDTRRVRWVIQGGQLHDRDALLALAPPTRQPPAARPAGIRSARPAPAADADRLRPGRYSYTIEVSGAVVGVDSMWLRRTGSDLHMHQRTSSAIGRSEWWAALSAPELRPLTVRGFQEMSGQRIELDLSFAAGRVSGSQAMPDAMGGASTVDLPFPDDAYESMSLWPVIAALPLAEGAEWTVNAYLAYIRATVPYRVTVGAVEEVKVGLEAVRAIPITLEAATFRQVVWASEAVPRWIVASRCPPTGTGPAATRFTGEWARRRREHPAYRDPRVSRCAAADQGADRPRDPLHRGGAGVDGGRDGRLRPQLAAILGEHRRRRLRGAVELGVRPGPGGPGHVVDALAARRSPRADEPDAAGPAGHGVHSRCPGDRIRRSERADGGAQRVVPAGRPATGGGDGLRGARRVGCHPVPLPPRAGSG
jgi:imidazolonepropionase-like amidohydrolase